MLRVRDTYVEVVKTVVVTVTASVNRSVIVCVEYTSVSVMTGDTDVNALVCTEVAVLIDVASVEPVDVWVDVTSDVCVNVCVSVYVGSSVCVTYTVYGTVVVWVRVVRRTLALTRSVVLVAVTLAVDVTICKL